METKINLDRIQAKIPFFWHSATSPEIMKRLGSSSAGLNEKQILVRQKTWGKNTLPHGQTISPFGMFARQFASPLVYILLIAVAFTWWLNEYVDMWIILIVVIVNALIGFFQEYRANKIFEKLKNLVRVEALVIREGKIHIMDSEELVPGDLIIIKGGNKIPADARVLTSTDLSINESILTGESSPVKKLHGVLSPKTEIADQSNMVFMGTVAENGEGTAVVTDTGPKTQIGIISLLSAQTADDTTPLQTKINKLGVFITEVFVVISLGIFVFGLIKGLPLIEMIKTTIAVAVAAIPEGLPAAISVILAVSSQRILEKKGLVMRLVAAETLGSTSVICTDKTGTLTLGQMRVEEILGDDKDQSLIALALANEAIVEEKNGTLVVKGEATDKAKLEKFLASGQDYETLVNTYQRLALLPFDSDRKYLASLNQNKNTKELFISGAPEIVIKFSLLPETRILELKKIYENYARRGFRVIALAKKTVITNQKTFTPKDLEKLTSDLTFLALVALRDPIRNEVKNTLSVTRKAGIKVVMCTGDHVLTARAIGLELGFKTSNQAVLCGEELDAMTDSQLHSRIQDLEILARVTPIHKMRLIRAWQNSGAVVAMTGDGINDAPALKAADIGIAVGSGTDVTKEAADLVLLDDSFSTITAAVSEGRISFGNIRKATVVVMSNAFTELALISSALFLSLPFPITAVQILWVNLITDSLPVLSLAFNPGDNQVMAGKPTSPTEPILNREIKTLIFIVSLFGDLLLVGIFFIMIKKFHFDLAYAQTFIFTATAIPTLVNIFAFKSLIEPITKTRLFDNKFMVISIGIGFLAMVLAVYMPILNTILKTVPLSGATLISLLAFVLLKLVLIEATKKWYRENNP